MAKLTILLGLIVLACGAIMHIVGLATPSWSVYDEDLDGPFRYCRMNACGETAGGRGLSLLVEGNWDAVRAMTIVGMILSLFAWLIVLIIFIGTPDFEHNPHAAVITSSASFLSIIIALIVWAAGVQDEIREHQQNFGKEAPNLGYSFFLSLGGGLLILSGGILGCVGRKRERF